MARQSIRALPIAVMVLLGALSASAAQPNDSAPPTAPAPGVSVERLLAAMPGGCESVMVRRIEDLLSKDSTQREMLDLELKMDAASAKADGKPSAAPPKNELEAMAAELPAADPWDKVLAMALEHKPLLNCMGGSGFEKPSDLGVGSYDSREVWVCKESFGDDPYAAAAKMDGVTVQAEKPVRILAMDKVDPVYGGKTHTERVYVGFYQDRTLVRAKSPEDVAAIVETLTAPPAGIPARWRKLAGPATLGSSMFVLRAFDPAQAERNWQLKQPLDKAAEPANLLRVVLPKAQDTSLTMTCITTDRAQARQMIRYWLGPAELQDTDAGLTIAAPAKAPPEGAPPGGQGDPRELMLRMQSAMGIYIAI